MVSKIFKNSNKLTGAKTGLVLLCIGSLSSICSDSYINSIRQYESLNEITNSSYEPKIEDLNPIPLNNLFEKYINK